MSSLIAIASGLFARFWLCVNRHLPYRQRRLLGIRLAGMDAEQITFRRDGTLWTAWAWDQFITPALFVTGGFQSDVIRALLAWLGERGVLSEVQVIVDIGANIGTTTVPLAQLTHHRIIAIEPYPKNFELLEHNIRQNGLAERVVCARSAIAADRGIAVMVAPATNSGGAELVRQGRRPSYAPRVQTQDRADVPTERLADILLQRQIRPDRVAFVWSDTQGCEEAVIETGRELWQSGAPLYVELWPGGLALQSSVSGFIRAARTYFDRYVTRNELLRDKASARPHPVEGLDSLTAGISINKDTDLLLLPRGFKFDRELGRE
ncbi:MAG: FkbM family methyltransferase [Chloroflexi bacterium]|nr:FkbM family methyltransferase [Chloroflexota bacterium]